MSSSLPATALSPRDEDLTPSSTFPKPHGGEAIELARHQFSFLRRLVRIGIRVPDRSGPVAGTDGPGPALRHSRESFSQQLLPKRGSFSGSHSLDRDFDGVDVPAALEGGGGIATEHQSKSYIRLTKIGGEVDCGCTPGLKSPQTNGICERFHKTILQEFYQVTFRKKVYATLDELQAASGPEFTSFNFLDRARNSLVGAR